MQDFESRLGEVLRQYAGEVLASAKGFNIVCPYHKDESPSATVFYDTGFFFCFSCGAKAPLTKGLEKLNVPKRIIEEFKEKKSGEDMPRLAPLTGEEFTFKSETHSGHKQSIGIVLEEPWQAGWQYREIRPENFTSQNSLIAETLRPSLVRLLLGGKGKKPLQEKFQRLCLHYGAHQVFARLSSQQEVRYYNSSGLSMKDPKLQPFGLRSFKLPPNQRGIFFVEGPYDWMRLTQNLQDLGLSEHFSAIALLGVSHWDSFLPKLELRLAQQMRDTICIFSFDNDKAGKLLTAKAINDCKRKLLWSDKKLLPFSYSSQDPGKADADEIKRGLVKACLV